jgi:hypothetical protein
MSNQHKTWSELRVQRAAAHCVHWARSGSWHNGQRLCICRDPSLGTKICPHSSNSPLHLRSPCRYKSYLTIRRWGPWKCVPHAIRLKRSGVTTIRFEPSSNDIDVIAILLHCCTQYGCRKQKKVGAMKFEQTPLLHAADSLSLHAHEQFTLSYAGGVERWPRWRL